MTDSKNLGALITDIDDIIVAYQEAYRHGKKRDTWAILTGGDSLGRDTVELKKAAIEVRQMKSLPATPEETDVCFEYPIVARNSLAYELLSKQDLESVSSSRRVLPLVTPTDGGRRSRASSVYSGDQTPSLYSQESESSAATDDEHSPHPHREFQSTCTMRLHRQAPLNSHPVIRSPPTTPTKHSATPHTPHSPATLPFRSIQRPRIPPASPVSAPLQTTTAPLPFQHTGTLPVTQSARPSQALTTPSLPSPGPRKIAASISPFTAPRRPPPTPHQAKAKKKRQTKILLVPRRNSAPKTYTPRPKLNSRPPPPPPMSQETTTTSPITREQAILPPPPTSKTSSFCKGAISLQQNPRSLKHALRLQTRPDGLYNHTRLFQCRHCHFSGPSYTSSSSGKKEIISDPTIHISSTGIPYRWTYLAKSHVKTKMVGEMGVTGMTSFACLVCMGVGRMSGVYGGVETLMEHLRDEHGVDGGFVLD